MAEFFKAEFNAPYPTQLYTFILFVQSFIPEPLQMSRTQQIQSDVRSPFVKGRLWSQDAEVVHGAEGQIYFNNKTKKEVSSPVEINQM